MAQRDELDVAAALAEIEAGHPAHRRGRVVEQPEQRLAQPAQLGAPRRAREAADAGADRVHRAAAEQLDDGVAGLLEAQPALDRGAVPGRQFDHVGAAEVVGRGQHVHVQRVTLDPLAAVVEAAQGAHARVDDDAERLLERVHGAHLVRHRADAADARRQVGDLVGVAAAQEGFEEARRLEDLQAQVGHLPALDRDVQRALALDACQRVHRDGARARHSPSSSASVSAALRKAGA